MNQTIEVPVWLLLAWPFLFGLLATIDGWRAKMWRKFAEQMGFPTRGYTDHGD